MASENSSLKLLKVPYFRQTCTATCGPASLMMVLKYWDKDFSLSRKMEHLLWRKSFSFFLFGGTFQFGLASAAHDYGYSAEIYQKDRFSIYYPRVPQIAELIENSIKLKAARRKIPTMYGREILAIISDALLRDIPPLVFVNLKLLVGENVFHWVVVTGLNATNVYINDPYVPECSVVKIKKDYPIPLEIFQKAIQTGEGKRLRFPPCVVLVYR